jgi:hypothetical protein
MKKKKLNLFDFDGTVANVPERPQGDKRGWNGKDWWGSVQSLSSPAEGGFYDGSVNDEVVEAFRQAENDPDSDTILLTGRRSVIAHRVRKVLRELNLCGRRVIDPTKKKEIEWFERHCRSGQDVNEENCRHEQYYCGDVEVTNGIPGTFGHKSEVLMRKVRQNGGSYESIDIWDDRSDHITMFTALGVDLLKKGQVQKFTIHRVFAPVGEAPAVVTHIPVTEKSVW